MVPRAGTRVVSGRQGWTRLRAVSALLARAFTRARGGALSRHRVIVPMGEGNGGATRHARPGGPRCAIPPNRSFAASTPSAQHASPRARTRPGAIPRHDARRRRARLRDGRAVRGGGACDGDWRRSRTTGGVSSSSSTVPWRTPADRARRDRPPPPRRRGGRPRRSGPAGGGSRRGCGHAIGEPRLLREGGFRFYPMSGGELPHFLNRRFTVDETRTGALTLLAGLDPASGEAVLEGLPHAATRPRASSPRAPAASGSCASRSATRPSRGRRSRACWCAATRWPSPRSRESCCRSRSAGAAPARSAGGPSRGAGPAQRPARPARPDRRRTARPARAPRPPARRARVLGDDPARADPDLGGVAAALALTGAWDWRWRRRRCARTARTAQPGWPCSSPRPPSCRSPRRSPSRRPSRRRRSAASWSRPACCSA